MRDYKYRVTGPRGGKYLTTTRKEAEKLTKHGGSFRALGQKKASKAKNPSRRVGGATAFRRSLRKKEVGAEIAGTGTLDQALDFAVKQHGGFPQGARNIEVVNIEWTDSEDIGDKSFGDVVVDAYFISGKKLYVGQFDGRVAYNHRTQEEAYSNMSVGNVKQQNPVLTRGQRMAAGRLKYKVFEGHDHYNNKPLYQVSGVNNDYVGEWHKKERDAKKELADLEVDCTGDEGADYTHRNPAAKKSRQKIHPAISATIKALREAGEKPFKSEVVEKGAYWIEFEVYLRVKGFMGGDPLYFSFNESNHMLTWHDFSHSTKVGKMTSKGISVAAMRRALDKIKAHNKKMGY